MTAGGCDETGDHADASPDGELTRCAESGCERPAAVLLHVPWDEDRSVCPGHARVLARREGVVAEPIEGAEAEWP